MRRNIRIKPGRTQSAFGFFVGLLFVGIGLFVAIPSAGIFGIFWTLMAVGITIVNGLNAFGEKGVASHEIQMEEEFSWEDGGETHRPAASVEERLNTARSLYDRGLISKEEYEAKRAEILKEL